MSPDTGHVYKGSTEELERIEKELERIEKGGPLGGPLMRISQEQAQDMLSKTPRERIQWAKSKTKTPHERKAKNKRKAQKKARRKNR